MLAKEIGMASKEDQASHNESITPAGDNPYANGNQIAGIPAKPIMEVRRVNHEWGEILQWAFIVYEKCERPVWQSSNYLTR